MRESIRASFSVPNMAMDLIIAVKVQVSPLPISVLITQTAVTYRQNIAHRSLPHFGANKAKATTKATLYEPPIILLQFR